MQTAVTIQIHSKRLLPTIYDSLVEKFPNFKNLVDFTWNYSLMIQEVCFSRGVPTSFEHHQSCKSESSTGSSYSWPHSVITNFLVGGPPLEPNCPICCTTFIPSRTKPNATCLKSKCSAFFSVMKNCELLVSRPRFAMDRMPGPVCRTSKFSSSKAAP